MALQITGTIKYNRTSFVNPYIKVDVHSIDGNINLEAKGWESAADYNANKLNPTHTKTYENVPPTNFPARSGNVAAAFQFHAEAYVKAQILAAFPTVQIADV